LVTIIAKVGSGQKPGAGGKLQPYDAKGRWAGKGLSVASGSFGEPITPGNKRVRTGSSGGGIGDTSQAQVNESNRLTREGRSATGNPQGAHEGKVWAVQTSTAVEGPRVGGKRTSLAADAHATNGDPLGNTTAPLTKEAVQNLGKLGYLVPDAQFKKDQLHLKALIATAPIPNKQQIASFKKNKAIIADPNASKTAKNTATRQLRPESYRRRQMINKELQRNGDGHTCGCGHCGVRIGYAQVELDKLFPASGYVEGNVIASCGSCNSGRADMKPDDTSRASLAKHTSSRRNVRVGQGRRVKAFVEMTRSMIERMRREYA
jgi:5-methylcytosine-specific restriction endonuclease McrA